MKLRPKFVWQHPNYLMLAALATFFVAKFDFFLGAVKAIWAAMLEFEPWIGREAGKDCSMIMWTAGRQSEVKLGSEFDAKALLGNTSFNM